MPSDILVVALAAALGIFILHIKSHIKFILLGLYIGVVLAETVAQSIYDFSAPRLSLLNQPTGYNVMQLVLLLVPTLVMGFNHSVDKKKWSLSKKLVFVFVSSVLLIACVIRYLPAGWQQAVVGESYIAWQIYQLFIPLLILGATLLVVESFHHKKLSKLSP